MKICVSLILLSILCPGGCPVYNFDLKTIEVPSDFNNDLKLESDLSSQINDDLLKMHLSADTEGSFGRDDFTALEIKTPEEKRVQEKPMHDLTEMSETPNEIENFVGTNLFDGNRKKCFSTEDIALLTARKDFESLIPKKLPHFLLTDEMVSVMMQYFNSGNKIIQGMSDEGSKRLTEKAFYDTLGGYLKSNIVPVTKFSFYAGKVNLKTVENVMALYHQCKSYLNTNGNGWKAPVSDLLNELNNVQIEPLVFGNSEKESEGPSCCAHLDLTTANNDADDEQMIVSLPKLDPEDGDGSLSNICLPFKRKRTFNLRSSRSAFIVVKFYETVTRCYRFQKMRQNTYNHKFKEWILEYIQVHLSDEQFYPGLGAVLRIYENLRRGKKAADLDEAPDDNNEDLGGENESEVEGDGDGDGDDADNNDDFSDDEDDYVTGTLQRTREFSEIKKASKLNAKSANPFDKIYERQLQSRRHTVRSDPLNCIPKIVTPKPDCIPHKGKTDKTPHSKTKSKTKSKSKPKSDWKSMHLSLPFFDPAKQRLYLKYLLYLIALVLLILLLIIFCGMFTRLARNIQSRPKKPRPPRSTSPGSSLQKKKEKGPQFYDRFRKKKKSSDEEILIKSDSKSVIQAKPSATSSSSTSSLACHPKLKCIPCTSKTGGRKSDAAVIETTSMDYSSSEAKPPNKGKQKIVTINEKKRSFSSPVKRASIPNIRNECSTTETSIDSSRNKCISRIGLQRSSETEADVKSNSNKDSKAKKGKGKSKPNTSSWETIYDT